MTFVYGTQAELIYSMPAPGAALVTTASAVLSGNTTTNPPYQLPPFPSLWSPGQMAGKILKFLAQGTFGTGATPGTLAVGIGLNTTQGTAPTAIILSATGALVSATFVPASVTTPNGGWEMECDLQVESVGKAAMTCDVRGHFEMGAANNAATANDSGCLTGAAVTTILPTVSYWPEVYATWGAASTDSIICTQFKIYGMN